MKNTIVFGLEASNEESYGEIANFIYKRENRLNITQENVKRILYKYYLNNEINNPDDWAKVIAVDIKKYRRVNEPHKIKNVTDRFEILYCIFIDKNADIIDLNNLFLIKRHYSDLNILALFQDCSSNRYFTISQFLYSVGTYDSKFYNECYFLCEDNVKRAQIKNISFSRYFTPLQIVDKANIKRLFMECKDILSESDLYAVLSGEKNEIGECDDLILGSIKILRDVKRYTKSLFEKRYIQVFQKLDVMAFVLLCYALCQEQELISLSLLERYAFQMQQYSNAVRQLAENIVFHSRTGCGVIAFRIHDKKSSYITDKYQIVNNGSTFLEIVINDFCRDNSSGNIAENFLANIDNQHIKNNFKNIQPRGFFSHEDEDKSVWEEYYRNPDNIGKHFGLRIFRSIVSNFKGVFGAESHSSYRNLSGDSFLSYLGNEPKVCMPGTRYHIAFPIEKVQLMIKKQDISLDSGTNFGNRIYNYLSYSIGEEDMFKNFGIFQSQLQKNQQISELSEDIQKKIEKQHSDIVYVTLDDMADSAGEIIAKALTIALFKLRRDLKVVLYQCTDNLKKSIFDTMSIFYHNADIEGMFYDRNTQIVIYSKNYEETVLYLSSAKITDSINAYITHTKCITSTVGYLNPALDGVDLNAGAAAYIPCDILGNVEINGKKQTLFEHYTEGILKNNIQNQEFGCQLGNTHMRLGSTIHINKFYEAEILFGNKLFVSRFAMLLVKDMRDDIQNIQKLTLYGYGTYSETVLVQMIEMIHCLYPEKKDIDYIILEREEERRGFLHKDRIRYNKNFQSKRERVNYFKDRKVAIIVLINSTLKTHMRLINMFKEENNKCGEDFSWLIRNYAVLLVGNKSNKYWKLESKDEKNEISVLKENILPKPKYFIQVSAKYQEPSECEQCFPTNPVAEIPLVEVNAASTIPNQAFGIVEDTTNKRFNFDYQYISSEERKLKCLKGQFTYGHVHRNENHFLYYFMTENICIEQRKEIEKSLEQWKANQTIEETLQYNIIVSPMHFSNAGFVELVNNQIFNGNAILLRIDFDKEYRCNAYTKYSYLRNYVEQLKIISDTGKIYIHYVDDAIISGRTFHRAKSLMQSIFGLTNNDSDIRIKIFDKVFVLVDRNSLDSRKQYVTCSEKDFYSFVDINISSLRTYGDSCVYCNLKKESDLLFETASTQSIANYWEKCRKKFELLSLEEYEEYKEEGKKKNYENRTFRRLFCTHMAQTVLSESHHGNQREEAVYLILKLLNIDYQSREKDKYEYFLSYIKCISRPFLVFKKVIKEAIFDIMLILIDATVRNLSLKKIINEVEKEKPYLVERRLILQFNKLDHNVLSSLEENDKRDLVKLLMKQLTELKSNYIIRSDKMDAIFRFMGTEELYKFEKYYLTLVDRLVGASSDTNKSIWLDNEIIHSCYRSVSLDCREWILLENTRAFRDGIEKLYKRIYGRKTTFDSFRRTVNGRIKDLEEQYNYKRAMKMFETFEKKYVSDIAICDKTEGVESENLQVTKKRLKNFYESLPNLPTLDFPELGRSIQLSIGNDWHSNFYCVKRILKEEVDEIENREKKYNKTCSLEKVFSEIDNFQFSNFYKLLQRDSYSSNTELSFEDMDMLACCVKILDLCRNEKKMDILAKVQKLAILFKMILNAEKVQFVIENKDDINLDEWKHNIELKYNEIIEKVEKKTEEELSISIEGKKHYLVIVEKTGDADFSTRVSIKTEKLIERMECQTTDKNNYIIDIEDGAVIWKLGNSNRSIWINIENREWCSKDPSAGLGISREIRKIMMFYQELKSEIFSPENDDFINEISHVRKELSLYNSNKVYTHTKDFAKEALFEQSRFFFENKKNKYKYVSNYPSYVLKLLADIYVSQYYRNGLRKNFYYDDRGIKACAKWSDFSALLSNNQNFVYCIDKEKTVCVKLKVTGIDEEDEILCRQSPSSIRELMMLIYALILNAAEQNRGKRQVEKNNVHSETECVTLEMYKEAGYLVIKNECEQAIDIEKIKQGLHHVPESEDDGISFWSFNCYVKQCINSLILEKLKEMERDISENQCDIEKIKQIGNWIKYLTSEECEIQPDEEEKEDKHYFKVKLPIFMEQYQVNIVQKEE